MIESTNPLDIDTQGLYSITYQPQFMVELQQNLFRFLPDLEESSISEKKVVVQPLNQEAKKTRKLNLNKKEVIRLYLKERLSQNTIAKKFKCNTSSIGKFLKKNNIKIRKFTKTKNKLWNMRGLNEKEIIKLYTQNNISMKRIAKRFDCSDALISKILKENSIKLNDIGEYDFRNRRKLKLNEDYIKHLYIEKNKTMTDIAQEMGCSQPTIRKRLKEMNVQIRPNGYYLIGKYTGKNSPVYKKPSPLKGKKLSIETRKKMSESIKLSYIKNPNLRKMRSERHKGKIISEESKRKMSETRKRLVKEGKIKLWNKGLTSKTDKRVKKGSINAGLTRRKTFLGEGNPFYGKTHSVETIKKIMKSMQIKPNNYEKYFIKLFKKNNLPYIYTGDGSFFIGKKNPDFIDTKHKICIEVFFTFFKEKCFGSVENYIKKRTKYFTKYGWKTIFIPFNVNLNKLNEKQVLQKITQFTNS